MSERERLASGTLSEWAPSPVGGAVPPRPAPVAGWEEIYRMMAPAQQSELLALAQRQGVVYAHQVPAAANGAGSDRTRQLITHLLVGKTDELKPFRPEPIDWEDTQLDDAQRDAVQKGMSAPDLCLIQGRPGTGKSRVVAELVLQAVRRGQRVLVLALAGAAVDRVLEQIGTRDCLLPLRCLAPDERLELLPPTSQGLTLEARRRQLGDQVVREARQSAQEAERACQSLQQQAAVLEQCRQLAVAAEAIDRELEQLRRQSARIAGAIEEEAGAIEASGAASGPFAEQLRGAWSSACEGRQRIEAALDELRKRAARCAQQLESLEALRAALAPLVEAVQKGRWWTWTWWRARRQGNVCQERDDLEARCLPIQAELERLAAESRRLSGEGDDCQRAYASKRSRLCTAESDRRMEEAALRELGLQKRRACLEDQWAELRGQLDPQPAALAVEAIGQTQEAVRERLKTALQAFDFARSWCAHVTQHGPELLAALVNRVNLVAAPLAALGSDPQLSDACPIFDLLVLEGAHQIGETELLLAARRARRWVLIGETETDPLAWGSNGVAGAEPLVGKATGRSPAAPPRLFHRLWQQLHGEPRQLPYSWFGEHGRWCCRLLPLSAEQRQHLERERVADCPDVELRILSQPRMRPVLAEVVFPATMPVGQAKEYIFRELQELPVQAPGRSYCWTEGPERVVLKLSERELPDLVPVALEDGIRELVSTGRNAGNGQANAGPSAYTCRLEFDRRAGWDRPRAEEWVRRHLGTRDLGRTARLDVPYRMQPRLALALWELLFAESCPPRQGAGPSDESAAIVFNAVPVPAGGGKGGAGKRAPPRHRPGKGGAGLELDLADSRHRERLPHEWRACLPPAGFVNLPEAQAVVRMLESLTHRHGQRANGAPSSVGVIALYPAQAELIRALVRQSPGLDKALELRIGAPPVFSERECGTLLISLTRSHSHRAVAFGEGPQQLTLALTRARCRIILFGDPGTLARRSQWQGAVDHLDDVTAERERHLITQLLRFVDHSPTQPLLLAEGKAR